MKMKHPAVWVAVLFVAVLFCSAAKLHNSYKHAQLKQSTSIKGTVSPAEAASEVWAMSPTENYKTIVANGSFELKGVRPGTYDLEIRAVTPYKDATKTGIIVTDGSQIDVGEIKMAQ